MWVYGSDLNKPMLKKKAYHYLFKYGFCYIFLNTVLEVRAFAFPCFTSRQDSTKRWVSTNPYTRRSGLGLSLQIDFDEKEGLTFDKDGPRIHFRAQKMSSHICDESGSGASSRTLLHYLALPAEQYSVLDAGTIFKKEDGESNQFTCVLDPISFFGNTIVAQIDAEVDVSPYPEGKSVIRVTGCKLEGSRLARFANGSFDVSCVNIVRATSSESREGKDTPTLSVDCQLEISALVPREGRWLPKRLVGKSGSIVIQQMLNIMVPRFLKQLAKDYEVWSTGDDSRAPVQTVSISNVDAGSFLNMEGGEEPEALEGRENFTQFQEEEKIRK